MTKEVDELLAEIETEKDEAKTLAETARSQTTKAMSVRGSRID